MARGNTHSLENVEAYRIEEERLGGGYMGKLLVEATSLSANVSPQGETCKISLCVCGCVCVCLCV